MALVATALTGPLQPKAAVLMGSTTAEVPVAGHAARDAREGTPP